MKKDFKILPASKKEIPIILDFIRRLADHVDLSDDLFVTKENINDALFSENSYVEVHLGYLNTEPISFVLFYPSFSTFMGKPGIHVEDLYIKPEFRGHGFGKAIFRYLSEIAISRNCGKIDWYAAEWNEQAVLFYHKMGAVQMPHRRVFKLTCDAMHNLAGVN